MRSTMEIIEELRNIAERLQENTRRTAGAEIRGKIPKGGVDAAKKRCRIVIGKDSDGNDVLSPWRPYKQVAGALKLHNPPSEGQSMVLRAESGDIEQGLAEPFFWSDENPGFSDDPSQHIAKFGNVTVTLIDDGLRLQVGGRAVDITSGGGHLL